MNELSASTLESIYLTIVGVITIFLVWSGWRQGVSRQVMTLLAIAGAYLVGWYGGDTVAPLFRFMRYPEPITRLIAGIVAGLATFLAVRTLRAVFFKKTAQLEPGRKRTVYGACGAALGVVFGALLLLLSSDAIRLLGKVASTQVKAAEDQKKELEAHPAYAKLNPAEEPNIFIRGLAKLGGALEQSSTGQFLQRYDPVPTHVYATIAKLAMVVSNQDSLHRFRTYPGVQRLTEHPKLLALMNDPSIGELLAHNSYLKLLRHDKVVALASDPEFAAEIKKVNFDDALDAALEKKKKPDSAGL